MIPGNNISALKIYRCEIPISRTGEPGEVPQGKFFFPDLPPIKNKLIVGIEAHIGGVDVTAVTYGNSRQLSLNQRITPLPPQISGFSFITLVNHNSQEVVSQFPLFALANKNNPNIIPLPPPHSRIIPIFTKLRPEKCYIEIPSIGISPYTTFYFSISLSFYTKTN